MEVWCCGLKRDIMFLCVGQGELEREKREACRLEFNADVSFGGCDV